ncbi:Tyrosine-protein phosphatase YwqE [Jeotgalibaca dankookensis]|uniref:Tyrosine-protein phosphatase n=1 Tax=Jeotgalibaca dankookensis TaxID=708126 RepID=A0A1S6IMC3_9LACT|nr:CpsB/CapC family capsule biosynthesis tyrosine phosphatase [Jeotgalibaca dankookensis]AQS52651.1 Tyrosine-protein phosphatase YwqE [Jeotgalibaca dankookensis]
MIDIHCHILPGIDDGARSMEDSLAMAELAVAEGITHILATPHHKNGKFENNKKDIVNLVQKLQKELDDHKINLTVYPGQEVRLYGELIEDINKDSILFTDEGNTYLLIEFPTMSIPHYTEPLFFQLMQAQIIPVIVHPERNQAIIEEPEILKNLIEKGALAQVTASSYVGVFGKEIAKLSSQLIEANLVHVLASDAHNTRGRAFHMEEAFEKMAIEFGQGKVDQFKENAKNIINGDLFSPPNPSEIKKKKKFFGLF